jgi:hypothetical protein
MTASLTTARLEIWDAIDNASTLSGVFKQRLKYDVPGSVRQQEEPPFGELPAIAIRPLLITPDRPYNNMFRLPYRMLIRVWTAHWVLQDIEALAEDVVKAINSDTKTKRRNPEFQIAIGPTNLKGADGQPGPLVMRADIQVTVETC